MGTTLFPRDSRELAIIADLPPAGSYTAIVSGVSNTTGVAVVEVYDLDLSNTVPEIIKGTLRTLNR